MVFGARAHGLGGAWSLERVHGLGGAWPSERARTVRAHGSRAMASLREATLQKLRLFSEMRGTPAERSSLAPCSEGRLLPTDPLAASCPLLLPVRPDLLAFRFSLCRSVHASSWMSGWSSKRMINVACEAVHVTHM